MAIEGGRAFLAPGWSRARRAPRRESAVFVLAMIVGALVGQAMFPMFVVATNFGGPLHSGVACDANMSSECVAENYTHYVYYYSTLTQPYRDAVDATIPAYDATDMTVQAEAYSSTNDVRVSEGNWGSNGAWAWTACATTLNGAGSRPADGHSHGHNWCKPQLLRWNLYYAANYSTADQRKAIACHELGHTMGLQHTSDTASCMKDPPTTTPLATSPTQHDKDRLNEHYP